MSGKETGSPKCLSAAVKISPWDKFKKFKVKSVNAKVSQGVSPFLFFNSCVFKVLCALSSIACSCGF
jgi:hypothetical protein